MKLHKYRPTEDEGKVNWKLLEQLNTYGAFPLTLSGFSQGFCYGHISYDGPRVHIYIWLYGSPVWSDNAYIIVPAPPVQLVSEGEASDFFQYLGPIIDNDTGQPLNDDYYRITTSSTNQGWINFANSGSITNSGTLSGSYIRA